MRNRLPPPRKSSGVNSTSRVLEGLILSQALVEVREGSRCSVSDLMRAPYAGPPLINDRYIETVPGAGTDIPCAAYSLILLRIVRTEIPRTLAAKVRFPQNWESEDKMSSRSTSSTV
jgi:hypothetical protein